MSLYVIISYIIIINNSRIWNATVNIFIFHYCSCFAALMYCAVSPEDGALGCKQCYTMCHMPTVYVVDNNTPSPVHYIAKSLGSANGFVSLHCQEPPIDNPFRALMWALGPAINNTCVKALWYIASCNYIHKNYISFDVFAHVPNCTYYHQGRAYAEKRACNSL